MGKAELIELISDEGPFILSDEDCEGNPIPERVQEVYDKQRWHVKFVELTPYGTSKGYYINTIYTFNIRLDRKLGITSSSTKKETYESGIVDKFLKIDGIEIF